MEKMHHKSSIFPTHGSTVPSASVALSGQSKLPVNERLFKWNYGTDDHNTVPTGAGPGVQGANSPTRLVYSRSTHSIPIYTITISISITISIE